MLRSVECNVLVVDPLHTGGKRGDPPHHHFAAGPISRGGQRGDAAHRPQRQLRRRRRRHHRGLHQFYFLRGMLETCLLLLCQQLYKWVFAVG